MEVKAEAAITTERPNRCRNIPGNFLALRKVTEEKDQRLVFLQEVNNANYELLESLLQGRELEEVKIEDLRQAMERRFQPKMLVQSVNVVRKSRSTHCRKAESKNPVSGSRINGVAVNRLKEELTCCLSGTYDTAESTYTALLIVEVVSR
ncbi:unnamed protein product [Haemonchus placei]|uniref:V-type proton ATPase subunit a n=1 Tax=Haemonchus placei TaxID=6290 RepID=A0A0N4WMV0_HAEPC|nr:unnamed protein product [Haemonchus placei]